MKASILICCSVIVTDTQYFLLKKNFMLYLSWRKVYWNDSFDPCKKHVFEFRVYKKRASIKQSENLKKENFKKYLDITFCHIYTFKLLDHHTLREEYITLSSISLLF